jgi:hypothetical protein
MKRPDVDFVLSSFSTPGYEWPRGEKPISARVRRGTAISLLIVAWIAAVDLMWQKTNLSILYIVPLTIMVVSGRRQALWRFVGLLIFLTYAIYYSKYAIAPADDTEATYLNFRLVNRTLVAASLLGIAYVLSIWVRWRTDQADLELPSSVQIQERELSATLALVCCIPLVILIAGIDFIAPATYNLAILYPIPLFLCVWMQSRRLLWGVLVCLLLLSAAAFTFGGPIPPEAVSDASLVRSRMIAAGGLVILAGLLTLWIEPKSATRLDS